MELPPPPYVLRDATVPACALSDDADAAALRATADAEGCVRADVHVDGSGTVTAVTPAGAAAAAPGAAEVQLRGRLVLPCFADLHTHIDKGHTWLRSPNPGALPG